MFRGKGLLESNYHPGAKPPPSTYTLAAKFNPATVTTSDLSNVPKVPTRNESLSMAVLSQPAVRLADEGSFPSLHREALRTEGKAFYKTKGRMETYLEDAHNYRDFLVWQPSQARGNTRGNNPSNFKPANDYYDTTPSGGKEVGVGVTQGMSNGLMLKARHQRSSQERSGELQQQSSATLNRSGSRQLSRAEANFLENEIKTQAVATKKLHALKAAARQDALDDISAYERRHHASLEISDLTKLELIQLIEGEGIQCPGPVHFDTASGTYRRVGLKKKEYLEFVRRELFKLESVAVCKRGQKLGKTYCVVSIFKSLRGAVKVVAYDSERSMEYHLFLTAAKLEDLDLKATPKPRVKEDKSLVFVDFSKSADERKAEEDLIVAQQEKEDELAWGRWSQLLIERLQLSGQGDLEVGPAKLGENGLSKGFCLTGRDVANREEGRKKDPSRVHVTAWFEM